MNALKGLLIVALLAVAFLSFRAVANADPDTIDQQDLNGVICGQMTLGETPGEIAERIGSDPRVAWPSQKVWDAVQECG